MEKTIKEICLDVIYQVRLAVAERLIFTCLWIMPPGHEREEFARTIIKYAMARVSEWRVHEQPILSEDDG